MHVRSIIYLRAGPESYASLTKTRVTAVCFTYLWFNVDQLGESNTYLFSFFPSAIKLWNSLPDFVINSTNLNNFKLHLDNYFSN